VIQRTGIPGFKKLSLLVLFGLVVASIAAGVWYKQNRHAPSASQNYDVIVVGAGPGGIAASLQAARMGAHVALLEETDWIGGQMTAGAVGTMDEGNNVEARKSGIYAEFVQAITRYYGTRGRSTGTCYYYKDSLCVDPRDGQRILKQMLRRQSANLTVMTGVHVSSVLKQGNTVTGVVAGGKHMNSKVVIDADEYGDVIAMANAAYRLGTVEVDPSTSGNSSAASSATSTAAGTAAAQTAASSSASASPAAPSCIQATTYSAVMKYYPSGVPKSLQFTMAPPGYTPELRKHFASVVSAAVNTDYSKTHTSPGTYQSYTAWRGLPDLSNPKNYNVLQQGQDITRTVLNLGNDSPPNGKLSTSFISDPSARFKDTCQAKQLTLDLAYYIQHELGQTNWAIANDEGYNTPYNRSHHCPSLASFVQMEDQLPQEPYVREGRRLVGEQTLTGTDLSKRPWTAGNPMPQYANSIAVGYYKMDLHGCNQPADLEPGLDNSSELSSDPKSGPFEIPMGVLIPQKVDGLLAAEKNISVSRLAEGAVREQPIAMDTGQAAGALAVLAVQKHEQPRFVAAADVQTVLKKAGVVTSVP